MPSVDVRKGEPVDKALRRLKKIVDKEGILKAFRARRYHYKPSEKARLKREAARRYRRSS